MTLQERIKKDLTSAMKQKDVDTKDAIRVIMGEFGRTDKKELSDDDVVKILKKLQKSEKEVLERKAERQSRFLEVIEGYLPQMASDDEIRAWIGENVDFSRYRNKMQAMGQIMAHFGSRADGNMVKKILQGL